MNDEKRCTSLPAPSNIRRSAMTKTLLGFALAVLAGGAFAADSRVDAALTRVSTLESKSDFAGIAALLRPYATSGNAEVEYYLAFATMNLAISGHQPEEIKPADIQPAIDFAERSGNHGSKEAWNLLYMIYGNGFGVPVSAEKAISYLKKGIAAGDQAAKLNYAVQLYEGSPLVDRNLESACVLFNALTADKAMLQIVSYYAGVIVFRGQCGKTANKVAGINLIRAAAEQGFRSAERDMGKNYEFGWTGPPDAPEAIGWYEKAAEHGDAEAQWRLGITYVNGDLGKAQDYAKARQNFEGSAASGYPKAFTDLGSMYAMGEGVERDPMKARQLYEQGADAGDARASRELAVVYSQGEGVPVDFVKARKLYSDAVEQGLERDGALEKVLDRGLK